MKHLLKLTSILFLTGNFIVQAQLSLPGGLPPGFHHALLDVLSGGPSFYGTAQILLSNSPNQGPTSISCDIAVLSGNMRLEVDSFVPGTNLPPADAANVKNMHSISILRPDRNRMYMIYPDFKSYVEIAYSKSTGSEPMSPPKINKIFKGKDAVGDQPCVKGQWNVTENSGEQYNATVWLANNWSNFPIRVQIGAPPAQVDFQTLHLEAPNGSLFEVPAGYIKYKGIQEEILQGVRKAQNAPAQ
jgi:hypothetical protein